MTLSSKALGEKRRHPTTEGLNLKQLLVGKSVLEVVLLGLNAEANLKTLG